MKETKSLLAKATEHKPGSGGGNNISRELAELAVAWATGRVRYSQVRAALNKTATSPTIYYEMAFGLREAFRLGLVKES